MEVLKVKYGSPDAPSVFAKSLKETGFAVLVDHPVPPQLIENTFKDWEHFFEQDQKWLYKFKVDIQSGYFPFRSENAKDSPYKDLKEFFHYYSWTALPQGMRPNTTVLFKTLNALASEVLGWLDRVTPTSILNELSMPLHQMILGSKETLLRPIHYPPMEGGEEPGAIRAAAHEDINLITLLPAATAPGLQVKDLNGHWHDVDCDPGSIAINAGDMLQMATGGYYISTTHQVINPKNQMAGKPRYSMPLFLHPEKSVKLNKEGLTAGQYLHQRLRELGLVKNK